jgi:hypothetical protein
MMVTKVTLNIPDDLLAEVKRVAGVRGITITDMFRQSLRNDLFFAQEESQGGKILIEKPNGKMVQIVRP